MTDSEIIYYTGLTCLDSCLTSILLNQGIDPTLFFFNLWEIHWNEDKKLVGERLKAEHIFWNKMQKRLTRGARVIEQFDPEHWTFGRNNEYTIFKIDAFYCHWHRNYQKEHADHYCLYYRSGEEVEAVDPMMSVSLQRIPFSDLRAGFIEELRLDAGTLIMPERKEICREIQDICDVNEQNLKNMYEMAVNMDLQEEFFGIKEGKYEVPLYRSLWSVMYCYQLFERYVRNHMPDEELEHMLEEIFESWKLWRSELLEKYMRGEHAGDLKRLHQIISLQKKIGIRLRKQELSGLSESVEQQENSSEAEPSLNAEGEILQAEQVIIQYIHDNIDRLRSKRIAENDRWDREGLGLDSLEAVIMIAKLCDQFKITGSFDALFELRTIREMAEFFVKEKRDGKV